MSKKSLWQQLHNHQQAIATEHMRDWFKTDPSRAERFSLNVSNLFLDYSKNRITDQTLALLIQYAKECELPAKITQLSKGLFQNFTEKKPVLHPFLRHPHTYLPDDSSIQAEIEYNLERMIRFAETVRCGDWRGFSGKVITDVINIGIGGSDLGSKLVIDALTSYVSPHLNFHFLSNIDDEAISALIKKINPETSLFIVASKSFESVETLLNAQSLKTLFLPLNKEKLEKHFIALTSNHQKAVEFGIPSENIFHIPDWVNGRFSLWSSVGLSIVIALGEQHFKVLLQGAAEMDQHFFYAPLHQNMPVIMALLSIWYTNFFGAQTHAIIPYEYLLQYLPAYLQQAHMESCGKSVNSKGHKTDYSTSPIIWGALGCDGQHSFHQLFHQGTELVPIDFIISLEARHDLPEHRDLLIANCLSQSQALMMGKTEEDILATQKDTPKELLAHKTVPGNKPSNILVLNALTPHSIGELLALYEHKIFVQSVVWDINAYDQWGVELGKQLSSSISSFIKNPSSSHSHFDSSTKQLIQRYLANKKKEK